MRRITWSILCAALVLVTGCVRSVYPVFPESVGVALLPANAILVDDDGKVAKLSGANIYDFDSNYSGGGYRNVLFFPIGEQDYYIAQALTDDKGYFYGLAHKTGDKLSIYTFSAGEFADTYRLAVTKRLSNTSVQIEDRREMVAFFNAALAHIGNGSKSDYRIVNMDDPEQRQQAAALIVAHDSKNSQKQTGKPNSPKESTPASAGSWSLIEETDPMSDAKILRIVSKAASSDGTAVPGLMRVTCGSKGLGFHIFWGAPMEDLYPTGEADFVAVDVRFDKHEPLRLAWAPSSDWSSTYNPNAVAAGLGQLGQSFIEALLPTQKVVIAWDEKVFHLNMRNSSRMVVRAATRSGTWAVLQFDTTGYAEVARAFPARCL